MFIMTCTYILIKTHPMVPTTYQATSFSRQSNLVRLSLN